MLFGSCTARGERGNGYPYLEFGGDVRCIWRASWEASSQGVAFCDKQAQHYDGVVRKYGLESRAVPFGSLGMDHERMIKGFSDPKELMDRFRESVRKVSAAGAEVIIPADGSVNTMINRERITELDGVLILNITVLLLKVTEAMADFYRLTGVSRSRKLLYQKPTPESIAQILGIYNLRSSR